MKKNTITFVGIGVGAALLTGSVFASYGTSNGYDALKQSLLSLPGTESYTATLGAEVSVDGKELVKWDSREEYDKASNAVYQKNNISNGTYKVDTERWEMDGKYIAKYENGEIYSHESDVAYGMLGNMSFGNDEQTEAKIKRFIELLADTFVGDIKNNFVVLEETDDEIKYSLSLTSLQIPEIANAGMSALFSGLNSEYEDGYYSSDDGSKDIILNMGTEPYIESVNLEFAVDKDGTFKDGSFESICRGEDKSGEAHDITIKASFGMENVGTTSPQKPSNEVLEKAQKYIKDGPEEYDGEVLEPKEYNAETVEID